MASITKQYKLVPV